MKDRRGRSRYVVFEVSPRLTKELLIKEFRSAGLRDPPYIIQCVPGKAVLRCAPKDRDNTIDIMSRVDPPSVPLSTSGTIRKIRRAYPELKAPKKPSR
ncbi:MAG: hypothetical protein FWG60_02880 [Methanomassiliicoccaceae archaeon]|nr:hypothetical protein [Methanomassiliicoccaceae archaeon]